MCKLLWFCLFVCFVFLDILTSWNYSTWKIVNCMTSISQESVNKFVICNIRIICVYENNGRQKHKSQVPRRNKSLFWTSTFRVTDKLCFDLINDAFVYTMQVFKYENGRKHLVNVCKSVPNWNINAIYFCLTRSTVYFEPLTCKHLRFLITKCN